MVFSVGRVFGSFIIYHYQCRFNKVFSHFDIFISQELLVVLVGQNQKLSQYYQRDQTQHCKSLVKYNLNRFDTKT